MMIDDALCATPHLGRSAISPSGEGLSEILQIIRQLYVSRAAYESEVRKHLSVRSCELRVRGTRGDRHHSNGLPLRRDARARSISLAADHDHRADHGRDGD